MRGFKLAVALCLALSSTALGGISIDVGTHFLAPNTPGQVIDIYSHTTDTLVQAVDFAIGILPIAGPAPVITAVDIIGPGTIFNPSNNGQIIYSGPTYLLPGRVFGVFTTTQIGPNQFLLPEGL